MNQRDIKSIKSLPDFWWKELKEETEDFLTGSRRVGGNMGMGDGKFIPWVHCRPSRADDGAKLRSAKIGDADIAAAIRFI